MEISKDIKSLDDIEYPKILYKYRNWGDNYHKRFITEREIYMASPREFIDNLDCKIPIRYDLMNKQQAELFYKRLINIAEPNLSRQLKRKKIREHLKLKEYKDKEKNKDYQKHYFEQLFQRLGIFSLTEKKCLDIMWEKYANNHKGFCIGYNSKILFKYLGGGGKVQYYDKMPILLPEPNMDSDLIRYKQVYFKEEKWSYENEYRTQKFWYNGATIKDRQIILPKEAFNCIILGKNISDEDEREIRKAVRENIGDIRILKYNEVC